MVTGWPLLVIFGVAIAFVLVSIIKFRLNPFVALLLTSILTAFLARMPLADSSRYVAVGFGNTLKGIGIVIGLGIILGRLLSESRATEVIAESMVKAVGKKHVTLAVALTGFLVSIPVFMDAAFVILVSITKKLSNLTKTPMITLTGALSISLLVSHNMIVPTPGPVEVANNTKAGMGAFCIYAVLVGLPAVLIAGWLYSKFIGRNVTEFAPDEAQSEESGMIEKKPSAMLSFFILMLPMILILFGSIMAMVLEAGTSRHSFFTFIGDKNIALLVTVLLAAVALKKYTVRPMNQVMSEAAEKSGMILLITGAGGAFGMVINSSGIGSYLVETLSAGNISILFAGFILAAVLRGALGSSTVALVTTSSILGPLVLQSGTSPVLVALAVCAGGNCMSLPNDSGFWVVTRFSDLKLSETLKAWTLGASLAGVVAFIGVLILNVFASVLPGLH